MEKVITYGPEEFRIFFSYNKKMVDAVKAELPKRYFVNENGNMYWAAPLVSQNIVPLSKFAATHGFRVDVRAASMMEECLKNGIPSKAPVPNIRGVFIAGELAGFLLKTPGYDPEVNAVIKASGRARWMQEDKTWNLPISRTAAKTVEILISKFNFTIEPGLAEKVNAYAVAFDAVVDASAKADSEVYIPSPDGLFYLPYQKAGIAYALKFGNALIADEPGLGKTIQVIGFSNMLPDARRILIIVPTTLRINWKREFKKWDVKGLTVGHIKDGKPESYPSTDVVITSYDLAIKHIERIKAATWDILAIDEAHNLKNAKGKRCKNLLGYEDRNDESKNIEGIQATHTLLLTGTPIVNRPKELWPLIHRINPARWDNFFQFGKRYCGADNNGFGWTFDGSSNLEELQRELRASGMVRRIKDEVLPELPKKIRQIIAVEDAGAVKAEKKRIQKHLDTLAALRAEKLLAYLAGNKEAYITAARELKQAIRTKFEETAKARHDAAIAKVPHVVDLVTDALENGKVVLFCHHNDVSDAYAAAFGDKAVLVDGRVSPAQRQARIDRFVNDPTCELFIGGIRAAGVGVDGLQKVSSHVIMAEIDCVPGILTQAEDRLCRIGQLNSILVWHVVIDGTIDARMVEITVDKQAIIDAAMDDKMTVTEVAVADNLMPAAEQEEAAVEDVLGALDIVSAEDIDNWLNGRDARKEASRIKSRGERITEKAEKRGLADIAAAMTEEQIAAVHYNLMFLAGRCDGAVEQDGRGFNATDAHIGHTLAAIPVLNNLQAAYARIMLGKYAGQLGGQAIDAMKA